MQIQDIQRLLTQHTETSIIDMLSPFCSKVFSILTLMQSSTTLPRLLYTIIFGIYIIQTSLAHVWPLQVSEHTQFEKVVVFAVFLISIDDLMTFKVLFPIVSFTLIVVICVIIIIFVRYTITKTTTNIALITINVALHFMIPLLITPVSFQTALAINNYGQMNEFFYIFLIIINLIVILVSFCLIFMTYSIDALSFYFKNSTNYCFRPSIQMTYMIGNAIFIFGGTFCKNDENTFYYFFLFFGISINVIILLLSYQLPFAQIIDNALVNGAALAFIIGNLLTLKQFNMCIKCRFCIELVALIVLSAILYIPIKARILAILKQTKIKSPTYGLKKLRFALMLYHHSLLDGGLVQRVSEIVEKSEERLELCRYICCFHEFQTILNMQLNIVSKDLDLSLSSLFQYYQLNQYQQGKLVNARVQEQENIIKESYQLVQLIQKFWLNRDSTFSSLEAISVNFEELNDRWLNVIAKYPSNSILPVHYARFLIECRCDFNLATKYDMRGDFLEEGKKFEYDSATICLLRSFPKYSAVLLKSIDISSADEYDIFKKELSLRKLGLDPTNKFEIQNSIGKMKLKMSHSYTIIAVLRLLAIILFWVSYFFYCVGHYNTKLNSMNFLIELSEIQKDLMMGEISRIMYHRNISWRTNLYLLYLMKNVSFDLSDPLLPIDVDLLDLSKEYSIEGLANRKEFYKKAIDSTIHGFDLQPVYNEILLPNVLMMYVDSNSTYYTVTNNSFNEALVWIFIDNIVDSNFNDAKIKSVIFNCDRIDAHFEAIMKAFVESDTKYYILPLEIIELAIILFFIYYIVILNGFYIFFFYKFKYYMNRLIKLIYKFSPEINEIAAKKMLKTDVVVENDSKLKEKRYGTRIYIIFDFIFQIGLVVVIGVIILMLHATQSKIDKYINLTYTSLLIKMKSLDVASEMIELNVVRNVSFLNRHPSSLINEMLHYNQMYQNDRPAEFGDPTKCVSIGSEICIKQDFAVIVYAQLATKLIPYILQPDFMETNDFTYFLFFETYYLYNTISKIPKLYYDEAQNEARVYINYMLELGFPSIFAAIVSYISSMFFVKRFSHIYKTYISLLMRLSPLQIASNSELVNVLIYHGQRPEETNTPLGNMIFSSVYPISCIGTDGTIISINQSFAAFFGYEEVQIIGLNLFNLLKIQDEQIVECQKEGGHPVSCKIMKFEIYRRYIVILFIDQSSQSQLVARYERIKKNNERLICAMNPVLYEKLTSGENHQFSIMCLDMRKTNSFTEYVTLNKMIDKVTTNFHAFLYRQIQHGKCYYIFSNEYEIMSFVFQVYVVLNKSSLFTYGIGITFGNSLKVIQTEGNVHKLILTGPIVSEARELSEISNGGHIIVSEPFYMSIITMNINIDKIEYKDRRCYKISLYE